MTVEALARYPREWAQAQFGPQQAERIADLLTRYSQYAARRKPELIDADSFALGEGAGDVLFVFRRHGANLLPSDRYRRGCGRR